MRRNSVEDQGRTKKKSAKTERKHQFSTVLERDPRVAAGPRHVEVIDKGKLPHGEIVCMVKVYAGLETPGSELFTVSCVDAERSHEVELRFDEKFAVSIRFRKQTDEERVAYAREQIVRLGGVPHLLEVVRSHFPKFGV